MPDQPFRILVALLEQPNELVTREALKRRIWPEDTFVDFEQGLNRAVNKLRDTLGDSAATPRFVETLPGRGYRFIGSIQSADPELVPVPPPERRRMPHPAALWTGLALAATVIVSLWAFRPESVNVLSPVRLTADNFAKFPPVLTDGARVYFRAGFEGETFLALAPADGGPSTRIPLTPPTPYFVLQDISPDGQDLLLTVAEAPGTAPSLWTLRLGDGGSRKIVDAPVYYAAFAPAGDRILLSRGEQLLVGRSDGSNPRQVLEVRQSRLRMLSWSPDGRSIRFEQEDQVNRTSTAWELHLGGSRRQLLPGWADPRLAPLGWAFGGRLGLFESSGSWWARLESPGLLPRGPSEPEPITNGEPEFSGPVRMRPGAPIYAIGVDRLGELQRLDTRTGIWESILDGASAEGVQYSPDGQQLLYLSYPQAQLWVRQADGTRPVQLTNPPLNASFARWSPDGSRIAFVGREGRGGAGRIYIIDSLGGTPLRVSPAEGASFSDPAWLPDGRLVFGLQGSSGRPELAYLNVADPKTGAVTRLTGSEGLFSPRCCSANGELAAMQWRIGPGTRDLVIFDWRQGKRISHLSGVPLRHPEWMPGGQWIAFLGEAHLMRWHPGSPAAEQWRDLPVGEFGGYQHAFTFAADGSLLRTQDRDRQQVYSLRFSGQSR